jgi:microcystin-dependent protein
MQRVDTSTAAASPPTQDTAGTPGYFTKGNPTSGTPATVPGQDWFNSVQEELIGIIVAAGLTPSKSNSTQLITAIKAIALAPGTVEMFAGSSAPNYWLLCDGAAISRTTYAALFTAIGTTWGAGNGTTTFNLPDMRGRAPIGVGTGSGLTARSLAAIGGEEAHALTAAENGPHTHNRTFYNTTGLTSGPYPTETAGNSYGTSSSANDSSGSGTAHNTMQPFAAMNFIIKT